MLIKVEVLSIPTFCEFELSKMEMIKLIIEEN